MTPERCLLLNSAQHLKHNNNVRGAISELTRNPEIMQTRVNDFEECLSTMKTYISGDPLEEKSRKSILTSDNFKNLLIFKKNYHDLELGSIALASHMSAEGGRVGEVAESTFEAIAEYANTGEWQFVTKTTDSGKLASGLLIEGYGEFLAQIHGKEGLARDFVLAFEEVLAADFPDSEMFKDIRPWMLAERNRFGEAFAFTLLPSYSPIVV